MFGFKEKLTNIIIDKICPIGEKAIKMCENEEDRLLEILDDGARKAEAIANSTLNQMKSQIGILRRNINWLISTVIKFDRNGFIQVKAKKLACCCIGPGPCSADERFLNEPR